MAGPPVQIRPFRPSDQLAVRRLVLAGLAEHFQTPDETRNPDLDDIQASYVAQGGAFLVAEAGGRIVGTGALTLPTPGTGQIVRISVAPAVRRNGIARQLVAALLDDARARGLPEVFVETNHDWHAAIALYERCGFVQYDRDPESVYPRLPLAEHPSGCQPVTRQMSRSEQPGHSGLR